MLDVTLLGCGGTMPLPERWLTSLYVQYNGRGILIDCGEGTQIAMKEFGCSAHNIDVILLTHFHGDHVMGLPGILMSMGMQGRTDPVTVVGPQNVSEVVAGLCIAAGIPFEVRTYELKKNDEWFGFPQDDLLTFHAFSVRHSVTTYGYTIDLHRRRKFDAKRAKEQNIPLKLWSRLQVGETIRENGVVYTPDMVLGEERSGIRLTYCTDTRPCNRIIEAGMDSDLMVLEGMYGDNERLEAAKVKKHMIFSEAAEIAKQANAVKLWLTHFSPSEPFPEQWLSNATEIFPAASCGECGKHVELNYMPEEKAIRDTVGSLPSDWSRLEQEAENHR
ncbi:MAG: ribonuclease Z [Solobacterium sp.]|nr:ribonuclease Z [Solobacterium sp.]